VETDGTPWYCHAKDCNPVPGGSDITELQVSNGYLFFNANDGAHGKELWRTDGTSEGTVMVLDLQPQISGETNSNPKDFVSHIDDRLYFICMRSTEHSSCDGQENCSLLVTVHFIVPMEQRREQKKSLIFLQVKILILTI
jgi:ELWxxDGT repeat protein